MKTATVETPLGPVAIGVEGEGVAEVQLHARAPAEDDDALLREAKRQLAAYFEGRLRAFDLPLGAVGTPFQRAVWEALVAIPFGETRSYRDLALAVGKPAAVRAVGAANGRNPIAIVVPCHRVIGADGTLVGYAGGLPTKRWLLAHERGERALL